MKRALIIVIGLALGIATVMLVRRPARAFVPEQAVVDYAVGEAIPALAFTAVRRCDASLAGLAVKGTATVETVDNGIRVVAIDLQTDEQSPRVTYLPCLVGFLKDKVHQREPGLGPPGYFDVGQRYELEAEWVLPDVTPSPMK